MSMILTPFPGRPATPWMHSFPERPRFYAGRGMGDFDVSQVTTPITDVFRTLQASEPGMYVVQNADGSYTTYRQPAGSVTNLPVGQVTGNLNTAVQGNLTSGAGVWILLGVGVVLLLALRKR